MLATNKLTFFATVYEKKTARFYNISFELLKFLFS